MGNFRQHITASTATGVVYGLAGYACGVPASTCLLAGGGCSMAGMLPDIDSGHSRSFQECIYLAAAVTSMLLINRLKEFPINPELITLAGAGMFLFFRFGIGSMLRKMTVHRGIYHSIPMAVIAGEVGFLLSAGSTELRLFKGFGIFLGFMSHLMLDEMFSVDLNNRRLKKSFGTAIKLLDYKNIPATIAVYTVLFFLAVLSTKEPELTDPFEIANNQHVAAGFGFKNEEHSVNSPGPSSKDTNESYALLESLRHWWGNIKSQYAERKTTSKEKREDSPYAPETPELFVTTRTIPMQASPSPLLWEPREDTAERRNFSASPSVVPLAVAPAVQAPNSYWSVVAQSQAMTPTPQDFPGQSVYNPSAASQPVSLAPLAPPAAPSQIEPAIAQPMPTPLGTKTFVPHEEALTLPAVESIPRMERLRAPLQMP